MPPLPVATAVLLADKILVEAGTNKKSLVGVYSHIHAKNLPLRRRISTYIEVVDAQGRYDFLIDIVRLEDERIVASGQLKDVVAADRLSALELVLHLPVLFDTYGTYEFRMSHAGRLFASRTFRVTATPAPKPASSRGRDDDAE